MPVFSRSHARQVGFEIRMRPFPKKTKTMPPIHPGETPREDFLKPLGLTANRLATELFVPVTRINDIVRCRRAITADTALRLAR